MAATANKGKKKKWGGGKRREIKVNTVFLDKKEHAKFSGDDENEGYYCCLLHK